MLNRFITKSASSWKDKLKGGVADKHKPSDFDSEDLKEGIKVEMEHTDDPEKAKEIAMDHMAEHPEEEEEDEKDDDTIDSDYYDELEDMEDKLKNKKKAGMVRFLSGSRRRYNAL